MNTHGESLSVIIYEIDVVSILALKAKNNPPIAAYIDREVSFQLAFKRM
jgi:hypothetical protein